MSRGGRRQGRPGVGYANRTDLSQARMPQSGTQTAAAAGIAAPVPTSGGPAPAAAAPFVDPTTRVPALDDPTGRPGEPVTTGLFSGAGAGPEAIGYTPPDPVVTSVEAAYQAMPTPELRRAIARYRAKGAM